MKIGDIGKSVIARRKAEREAADAAQAEQRRNDQRLVELRQKQHQEWVTDNVSRLAGKWGGRAK